MLHAVVSFIGSVTERQALSEQHAVLNFSQAPGRPWLDLSFQLVSIATGLLRGAGIAAVIGGSGLLLYYLAFKAGIALNIVAAALPSVWWRIQSCCSPRCRTACSRRSWSSGTC